MAQELIPTPILVGALSSFSHAKFCSITLES